MVLFYCFNALRIGINLVRRESTKCVKTNLTRYRVYNGSGITKYNNNSMPPNEGVAGRWI
jgi:hypothetical protein